VPAQPISFARGAPAPELIPVAELAECAYAVAQRDGPRIFSYGPGGGYGPLREWVAERHGVDQGRVVLTVGGLLGFVLYVGEALARRPGRVLVEGPTYDRPLKILARQGAEIVVVRMDDEGLDPDALEAELCRRPEPPSFLYTIPTFQNPSGRTLSRERRRRLVGEKLRCATRTQQIGCDETSNPPRRERPHQTLLASLPATQSGQQEKIDPSISNTGLAAASSGNQASGWGGSGASQEQRDRSQLTRPPEQRRASLKVLRDRRRTMQKSRRRFPEGHNPEVRRSPGNDH